MSNEQRELNQTINLIGSNNELNCMYTSSGGFFSDFFLSLSVVGAFIISFGENT